MAFDYDTNAAEGPTSRRLFVYNGGFLTQKRVRRILKLAGWDIKIGKPGPDDWIGIWGKSPTSPRGESVAKKSGSRILRVEDALLRSVLPGREGSPPLGLLLDKTGVHFDSSATCDLETLLASHPLDDTALLDRARFCSTWIQRAHLSKYNAFDIKEAVPQSPYVVVIDQTRGDAAIANAGANANSFKEMLYYAQDENPGAKIIIKTHPETVAGHREGHFSSDDITSNITLVTAPISPWKLFEGATKVYTVSSGLGFEAIFAGHKPRTFGQPFYAGWGLTEDAFPISRRKRTLTRSQLFAAAMILYPTWYDPYHDRLCELEDAIAALEAQASAWRTDHKGHVAIGMRLWKRKPLQKFFGAQKKVRFQKSSKKAVEIAKVQGRNVLIWAGKETPSLNTCDVPVLRVEDGFIRSSGLGANLVPPMSLVTDDLGIYYDPTRESRLERLIAQASSHAASQHMRVERLIAKLKKAGLSKYNLSGSPLPDLPSGHRILVPGQVEDDASILKGAAQISSNAQLLRAVRDANPAAHIIYKPHPDVEAGLRAGKLSHDEEKIADFLLPKTDPISVIEACDEIWTMTSLLGFEALLRDKPVTCLGAPFYAGWGLTKDLGPVPARRQARPTLLALAHATLIEYPRYFDPKTSMPCPAEVIVERLATNDVPVPGTLNRSMSKLQGLFASYAWFWR